MYVHFVTFSIMQSLYKAAHTAAVAGKGPKYRTDLDISKLATELVRVPLLADLDTAALRKLAQEVHAEVHLPGSVLMRQGDHGERMLLLTQGAANIFKIPDDDFVVMHSSGRWPARVPPVLKPAPQVRIRSPHVPCSPRMLCYACSCQDRVIARQADSAM